MYKLIYVYGVAAKSFYIVRFCVYECVCVREREIETVRCVLMLLCVSDKPRQRMSHALNVLLCRCVASVTIRNLDIYDFYMNINIVSMCCIIVSVEQKDGGGSENDA